MIFREYQTEDSDVEVFEFDEDGFGGLRATLTRKHGQKRIDARFIDAESGGEVARMFFTDYFEAATAAKCFVYGIRSAARIEETKRELEKMGTMCRII